MIQASFKLPHFLTAIAYLFTALTALQAGPDARSPTEGTHHSSAFKLADQNKKSFSFTFPRSSATVFLVFQQSDAPLAKKWKRELQSSTKSRPEIKTVASLGLLPPSFESTISSRIARSTKEPVLLDWDGVFPAPRARSLLIRIVSPCGSFTDITTGRDMKRDVAKVVSQVESTSKSRDCKFCKYKRF